MDKNKALIGLGIIAALATVGTTVYYITRKPEEEGVPDIEEDVPYEPPPTPGLAEPGGAFLGTGTSGIAVPAQFQW